MPTPLDQFNSKLVTKILNAEGDAQAIRYIYAAVTGLKKKKINGYVIARFMDRTVSQLASFPSSKMSYSQWNIVKLAILNLEQMRAQFTSTAA